MELIPSLWVQKHNIKNEAGLPIEFDSHYFLKDIYDDMSDFQVVLKPPQVGMTVLQLIKTLWCAMKKKWDIIYTLPTSADVTDMAGGKVNRIIAQNPILSTWVKDHDTVEQKAVGDNIIYYRGTYTNKAAMMVSSKLNAHDEVDASDASVITQYETRLEAQSDGKRWYFSHPSIAGHGVDIHWQQSDKKEWFITCPSCKDQHILVFPGCINMETKQYICKTCKAVLPDYARNYGEWRPTTEGKFSGYHISQMMCGWISAENIIEKKNDPNKTEQYFYNYVLGLPYVGSDNKIEPEVVLRNVTPVVNDQDDRIIIGVDTGLPIHYILLNKQGVFYNGTCTSYDTLEGLLNRFPKSILVSDQGGDLIGIRELQKKYQNRVFLCYYRRDRKTKDMIKWGENGEYGTVIVDRNRMIQMMVEQMRDVGRFKLNGSREDWQPLANHFGNIYRVAKETPFGVEYSWERNGPDHFCHALLYALVGLDKFVDTKAVIIGGNDVFSGIPRGMLNDPSGRDIFNMIT